VVWKFQTSVILKGRGLFDIVAGEQLRPSEAGAAQEWNKNDAKARVIDNKNRARTAHSFIVM